MCEVIRHFRVRAEPAKPCPSGVSRKVWKFVCVRVCGDLGGQSTAELPPLVIGDISACDDLNVSALSRLDRGVDALAPTEEAATIRRQLTARFTTALSTKSSA
jgi:hypothetical protein